MTQYIELNSRDCSSEKFAFHFEKNEYNNKSTNEVKTKFIEQLAHHKIPYTNKKSYEGYDSIIIEGKSNVIQILALLSAPQKSEFKIVNFVDHAPSLNYKRELYQYVLAYTPNDDDRKTIESIRATCLAQKIITVMTYYQSDETNDHDTKLINELNSQLEQFTGNKGALIHKVNSSFIDIMSAIRQSANKIKTASLQQRFREIFNENKRHLPLRFHPVEMTVEFQNSTISLYINEKHFDLLFNELSEQRLIDSNTIVDKNYRKIELHNDYEKISILHYISQNFAATINMLHQADGSSSKSCEQILNELALKIDLSDTDDLKLLFLCSPIHSQFYGKLMQDLKAELKSLDDACIEPGIKSCMENNSKVNYIQKSPFTILISQLVKAYDNIKNVLNKNYSFTFTLDKNKSMKKGELQLQEKALKICLNRYKHYLPDHFLNTDPKTKVVTINRESLAQGPSSLNNLQPFS